ncbi:DUF3616 domain-containing protein [Acaryochloris sp. CCMEE 5410]|uniref:DUF3616 domain-containing protein n=1 Tax=Acaryochloris sp. CCMEE 5410 TaxID=310037 RepID=UPI000494910F|nr:DUF3616 domain-containing protein [Acaryochloris sp. CCMEE 5410]KAI9135321.1 DUF3616 domain-containing protein [Acaryochloris sp. CCMEE 5410]
MMASLRKIEEISFLGEIHETEDISAIAYFEDYIFVGSDESQNIISLLKKDGQDFKLIKDVPLELDDEKEEIDIEGMSITTDGKLCVIGSHSSKRKRIKATKTYAENRQRLETVVVETKKNTIFQLKLDGNTGQVLERESNTQLKGVLEKNTILSRFLNIPSKENGIDIEGLAADNKYLYIGFRGPVLRGNFVPVMVTTFDDLLDYELRFVQLAGNGIRDITRVQDGFLLIAGPVGDGLGPYQLYFWNGEDTIPGEDRPDTSEYCRLIGEIPRPSDYPEAKAEGLTILEDQGKEMTAMMVYDGVPQGAPTIFTIEL